jgi:hypothetical protein
MITAVQRTIEWLRCWWRGGDEKYTVACDRSPFWYPGNDREMLFHVVGRKAARRVARRWVSAHPCGQARVIEGHVSFEEQDVA